VRRLTERQEWKFFSVLPKADRPLAVIWWILVLLRAFLPAVFAIAMGILVSAVRSHGSLVGPLVLTGAAFVLMQVLSPVHTAIGANLGDRVAAWLYDRLTDACIRPAGIGHLEDPALTNDLTLARDFDLAITAPPMFVTMDFIATGLVQLFSGVALAIVLIGYAWWAALLLAVAWLSTHWLLRESTVWRDRNTPEVQEAQRESEYTYRLAVDPPAAKELRLFGLVDWTMERFLSRRKRLFELQYRATRLRERSMGWSLLIVLTANGLVFWSLANSALTGAISLGQIVVFAQAAVGASLIGFGGINWALDGAAAPIAAVLRLGPSMEPVGRLTSGPEQATGMPARYIAFRNVSFAYTPGSNPILRNFSLTIPAGSSLAIVGRNGAGKTTLAKLLCRLYDPQSGGIEADGIDLRRLDSESWRSQVSAVFQDFTRLELSLRENVAPFGADDELVNAALARAGATNLAALDTVLARGYEGGIDLSGGQWQRVALARALCAVQSGARLVILDEPTAQLDVRGEAEIFERILTATRQCTTVLISHRFSTVRRADRICVLEEGRVVELGSHEELMSLGGRYRTMFELQARQFESEDADAEVGYDVLA